MSLDMIEQLQRGSIKKRRNLLLKQFEKNVQFLRKHSVVLSDHLRQNGAGRFEIQVTENFFDLLDRNTKQYLLPRGRVYEYVTELGSWHHSAWIDKLEVVPRVAEGTTHGAVVRKFLDVFTKERPDLFRRMSTGIVSLPKLGGGRRYSGACIFLGVFTGLHILHYLARTEVRDAVFVEPDIECFGLSCYFVDYEAIEKRFGRLILHVGPEMPSRPVDLLFRDASVSTVAWLRMLPAYPSPAFDVVERAFHLRWRAFTEIFIPFDLEVRNMVYGARNLKAGLPLLLSRPKLSGHCRIAVVGSGPSLDNDIEWLRENQDRLIIICATSTVRVLKRYGIRPDFQSMLNTEMTDERFVQLELESGIPMVSYYKANPALLARFETPLLIHESGKANAVRIKTPFTHTHPTTGNLAVALATYVRPQEIYLLGFDMGFREAERSHAGGTWHDDKGGVGHAAYKAWEKVLVKANFPESEGEIYTLSYHNSARRSVEGAVATYGKHSKVYNFSDGSFIAGTEPARSTDHHLSEYSEKASDMVAIIESFSSDHAQVWEAFETSGADLLGRVRATVLDMMSMERFSWRKFSLALDKLWPTIAELGDKGDIRVEAYSGLLKTLVINWYRMLVFADTAREVEEAYETGKEAMREGLDALEWPAELDARTDGEVPMYKEWDGLSGEDAADHSAYLVSLPSSDVEEIPLEQTVSADL